MSADEAERPIVDAEQAQQVGAAPPGSRAERAHSDSYRSRFAGVYLALAVIAGGAIGAFVVLLARPDAAPAPAWSAWEPTGSAEARVRQIADQVSIRYKLPSGRPLSVATVQSPPRVTISADQPELPVRRIVIRPDTSKGRAEASDVKVVDASNAVVFNLCGLSQDCSIAEGNPTPERHELLRREALELALYTFRYVDGVNHVAVFLPPPPVKDVTATRQPQTSVFLARGDVAAQLRRPLSTTLGNRTPGVGQIPPTEVPWIEALTGDRTYTFEYSYQPADNSMLAVLSPA